MNQLNIENGSRCALRYEVIKNALREKNAGEISYCARVYTTVKSLREIAETMVHEGSKYKAIELFAILQDFTDITTRLLQEGYAVNVGSLVRFRPSIQGKFTSEDDAFTRGRHRIVIRSSTGSILRDVAASATVERINKGETPPKLLNVFNCVTGTLNTVCSTGTLTISGKRLSWNPENPDEGFFTTLDDDTQRCELLHVNEEQTCAFIKIPHTLQEGDQITLTFRTRQVLNGPLRNIPYPDPLTYEMPPSE